MATPRLAKRLSALKNGRKAKTLKRQEKETRRPQLEQLEDRRLMAVAPPVFILPNNGVLFNPGDTRSVAPKDLTFRFTQLGSVDPNTVASGVRLIRAGQDGVFGNGNDVVINPGFIGLGDNNREVVMRFAETLPDDTYRVTVVGAGTTPLRDTTGGAFNSGANYQLDFRLDLGAQIIAVVPQPVTRAPNGTLQQARNQIVIYFNNDDLNIQSATNPDFYRLYVTKNTLDPQDDVEVKPTQVVYDPATDTATLTFGQVQALEQLAGPDDGSRDPAKSFRLRVGTDEPRRLPVQTNRLEGNDPGSRFTSAHDLGNLITTGAQGGAAQFAQAIEAQTFTLPWPGDGSDPGHRDIQAENHLIFGNDGAAGVQTIFYNFRPDIGTIPNGVGGSQPAFNLITEAQKQRAREVFEIYSRYAGVQFVETASQGLIVATGDLRVIDPLITPLGPGGIIGLAVPGAIAVMDNAETWNDGYGGNWFDTAMHEIGHMLGLGHSYDLGGHTVQGESPVLQFNSPAPEPIFPGDHDIVHSRVIYRPEGKDIDMYRFVLDGTGVFTAETFAERLPNSSFNQAGGVVSSGLDTHLTLYRENANGTRELIARNDDYFSKDSFLELNLAPGTYYVGVSASGNDNYDPNIEDSGIGGTTQGSYEVKFDFRKSATQSIVDVTTPTGVIPDTLAVPFDGNADGNPGGVHNFWFRSAAPRGTEQAGKARTLFVDKAAPAGGNGSLGTPFNNIQTALQNAQAFDIVRIVGNDPLGNDGGAAGNRFADNRAYRIGFDDFGTPLPDGSTLNVPKDVTVMIDAGAIFQMRRSQISVGSVSPSIAADRSGGALQVLGTPTRSVFFTSYNETGAQSIGQDQNPLNVAPAPGDWGGLAFTDDLDRADGRFEHANVGVFLNYVNHADIRYGGGQVNVNSVFEVITPIHMKDARPTVTQNIITRSADAAISANPDSFEETNFQAPRFWPRFSNTSTYNPSGVTAQASSAFSLDYKRIGPEIHGNRVINNSTNGLFVRTTTNAGSVLEELTVAGRFNDTDIVHVIQENLVIRGTPGGATLESDAPPVSLIVPTVVVPPAATPGFFGAAGSPTVTSVEYKLVYMDLLGNEGAASQTFSVTLPAGSSGRAIQLHALPIPTGEFVARRLYRRIVVSGQPTPEFTLVDQIPAQVTSFLDRNLPRSGEIQRLRVLGAGGVYRPRLDASLIIDPSIVVKSEGARIDVGMGAQLHAEGRAGLEVVFTSLNDDRYGAGGTFDTPNDNADALPAVGERGDWGGIFFNSDSNGSLDHAVIAFGGGLNRIEGTFTGFNAIEIHQADVRIANSEFEQNFSGLGGQAPANRFGRGFNAEGTIFVRGAQPVIFNNTVHQNESAFININANALNADGVVDRGRQTGLIDRLPAHEDNNGPLIDDNRLVTNGLNGMVVRGATLTTETVWDDTDIVHILFDAINAAEFHTYGGIRLESSATESLVVKALGDDAGINATGRPLEIDDRIGGIVQVIGQPGFPVVMTSLNDCSVGAGFTPLGVPQTDTLNQGGCEVAAPTASPFADVIVVMDESGTMTGAQQFSAQFITDLEAGLLAAGIGSQGGNQYGLVGFGGFDANDPTFELGRAIPVGTGGGLFGTAQEYVTATQQLTISGFAEDGYSGINVVTTQYTPRANAAKFVILVTDEPREILAPNLTFASTFTDLTGQGYKLQGILNVGIVDQNNNGALALDAAQNAYSDDGQGGFVVSPNGRFQFGAGTTVQDYGNLVHATGGIVGDINQISASPAIAQIFSQVLVSSLVAQAGGTTAGAGDWAGITIDEWAHDRNVETVLELESATGDGLANAVPEKAQVLGQIGPHEKSGDETLRLGYTLHGLINNPSDVDVYSFSGRAGTEVWIDVDRTRHALDAVIELIDNLGNVVARSISSPNEDIGANTLTGIGRLMQKTPPFEGTDFYTTNPRDPGMRVVLPGPTNSLNTYHVRIRSNSSAEVTEARPGSSTLSQELLQGGPPAIVETIPGGAGGIVTVVETQKGDPFTLELQTITLTGTSPFRLTFAGQTTGFLPATATAFEVQTALEGLSNIGVGDVLVLNNPGGGYGVIFSGALAFLDVPEISGEMPSANEVQRVTLQGAPSAGVFTLTFAGQTTAPIAFNASADDVKDALEALPVIPPLAVNVTAVPGSAAWDVEFVGTRSATNVTPLTGAKNEIQLITPPATPTFTLIFNGEATTPIPSNASAAAVRAALEGLPNLGAGDVQVSQNPNGSWNVTFVGAAVANQNHTALAVGVDEIQRVSLGTSAPGVTFTLTFNGQTTAPIASNASAAVVQAALEDLASIDVGDVVVTGAGPWDIQFTGQYSGENVPLLGVVTSDLTGGVTTGAYQVQLRLREYDEIGGTSVRFARIKFAQNGISVFGQPTHSPLAGEHTETPNANDLAAQAQVIGNLLNSDRGALGVAGSLSGIGDVDWYQMEIRYDATQGTSIEDWFSTMFDIDYADGLSRPNTVIHVFDLSGNLILVSRDGNVADDRPGPLTASDVSDLSRGSVGTTDPWIGPAEMPQGTYLVAISNDNRMPIELNQYQTGSSANPLIRLEPVNSVRRIVEDHIDQIGGTTGSAPVINVPFLEAVPWNLHDVSLYVTRHGGAADTTEIYTVDPFFGTMENIIGRFQGNTADLAMHPRGQLYAYTIERDAGNFFDRFADENVGNYLQIDPGLGTSTNLGDDGIETYEQDPASAMPAPVRNLPQPRRGEGVHFRATDIAVWPGNGLHTDYIGLAVGGRDAVVDGGNDFRNTPQSDYPNILYAFDPDSGQALPAAPVRTGNGLLAGARTQIVERAILDTFIDEFPPAGGASALQVVEATEVALGTEATRFRILDEGYAPFPPPEIPSGPPTNQPTPTTFRVQQGIFLDRTFEFDAGPEAIFEINPNAVNQQINDGEDFDVVGAQTVRLEFDTGNVINVTGVGTLANYPVGSTITITDVNPDPAGPGSRAPITYVFEFTVSGNTTIPNSIPILVGGTADTMANNIEAAINNVPGITTDAERLPGTGRISLTNNYIAFPDIYPTTIYPEPDSTAAENNVPGLNIVGASGTAQNTVVVRIEETSTQQELRDSFARLNAAGLLPTNSVLGVSGVVNGFNRVVAGFDGNRINFSGATSLAVGSAADINGVAFEIVGSQGGVTPGNVAVPFLAEDTQAQLAQRAATALIGAGYTNVSVTPTGTAVIISGGNVISADDPLDTAAEAPGGTITGLATINQVIYMVTDTGGLFRMNGIGGLLDYINTADELLVGGPGGAPIQFSSLAAGPRHVEGGRYQNMLFGIDTFGELYAFDTQAGDLQPIFNSVFNPATGQMEAQTSVQTGLSGAHGLKFSNLDYNLWHNTPNRQNDAGHGINEVFDRSRRSVPGRSSVYFGFETVARNGVPSDQRYAPTANIRNYDFLNGSHGSIETATFDLTGYTSADKPTLYFNYFMETENQAGHNPNTPEFFRDSFRVFAGGDDGVWHPLVTNNTIRHPGLNDDEIDPAANRIQEDFDNSGAWRQIRVSLGDFAGRDNLRLKFDFSTAGSMNVGSYTHLNGRANTPTNGDELRTVDGVYLRDGQRFTLTAPGSTNRTFEFDMGYTLVATNGAAIQDGANFTIDGVTFEFDLGDGITAGNQPIVYLQTDSPRRIAEKIRDAILSSTATSPLQLNENRINLRGGGPGGVFGALSVTQMGMPAGFIEGAPGATGAFPTPILVNVHAGMDREQVREAIALVMANVYAQGDRAQIKTHNEIVRLVGYRWASTNPLVAQSAGPHADPVNQRLLGATTSLQGDQYGAFNVSRQADGGTDNVDPGARRAQDNAFEGVYIDDIIIGFAERGEMVTGANGQTGFVNNAQASDTNIPGGSYQLEVRGAPEAGLPDPPPLPELILLPSIDTNDRLSPGRTVITPSGAEINDGAIFALDNGLSQLTFEFNDTTLPGPVLVTPGHVRIDYTPRDTNWQIAQRVVRAINSTPVQSILNNIQAQLSDGIAVPLAGFAASTTNRINLLGPVGVPLVNAPPAPVGPLPTGPEVDNGLLIDNDVNVNVPGHFNVQPGLAGNIGLAVPGSQSGVTMQGANQTFVNADFIFDFLNYVDVGSDGLGIDLSTTTITQPPQLVSPDLVVSKGWFMGLNGRIDWLIQTHLNNGEGTVYNTITFTSVAQLGNLRFINYLDEDIGIPNDDFLLQAGTPGEGDFRLFTLDDEERIGFSQGGIYEPGALLSNATYTGWAADRYNDLQTAITGLGTAYSVAGNIDLNDLRPMVDTDLGPVHGLADVTTAMAWNVEPTAFTATITTFLELLPQAPPSNAVLVFETPTREHGDENRFRDQGQIILYGNEISHSAEWGIRIDAAPRNPADGSTPHHGPVRNTRELNPQRLVPGVVVANNVIHNNTTGGILYSGDPNPDAPRSFGRIVNNTVYGQGGTLTGGAETDIGIQVDENAAPTLMNNIIANFNQGVLVDPSSQLRTVLGGNLFQGNDTHSNVGLGGDFPIVLDDGDPTAVPPIPAEPLFIDAQAENFYLAPQSRAIDSAVDSLLDRPPLVTVKSPLGITPSPIISPDRDAQGQRRVDDPNVSTPGGFGLNPFKDRGAIDRVDFSGPRSLLINPLDNDALGVDLDLAPSIVVLENQILNDFSIRLLDRTDPNAPPEGSDIDDSTVTASSVQVHRLGTGAPQLMTQGVDYSFSYDSTNNIIRLQPGGGLWPLSATYRITIDNSALTGIKDRAGNTLLPNQLDGSHIYTIFLGTAVDWGDAPNTYKTTSAAGGPSHVVVANFFLGATNGAENDGRPSPDASLDTSDDGIEFVRIQPGGQTDTSQMFVTASAAGKLDAWFDLNQDGDFEDPGEHVLVARDVPQGRNLLNFTMPEGLRGTSFARFRFTSTGISTPTGSALDGEVEDYQVLMTGPEFQNSPNANDVNDDNFVSPIDALIVINFLNAWNPQTGGNNPLPPQPPLSPLDPTGGGVAGQGRFVDVNGDGFLSPIDALLVINELNRQIAGGEGEAEGEMQAEGEGSSEVAVAAVQQPLIAAEGPSIPAVLLASPDIVIEERVIASSNSGAEDPTWLTGGADPLELALLVADERNDDEALGLTDLVDSDIPIGPLDEANWDDLLADLADERLRREPQQMR